jgi:hypothetical protein
MPPPDRTDMVLMGAGLLSGLGWVLAWVRRRRKAEADVAAEEAATAVVPQAPEPVASRWTEPPDPAPDPEPVSPPPSVPPAPPAPPVPAPPPAAVPAAPAAASPFTPAAIPGQRAASAAATAPLALEAVPERLTISLVMATLRYRLRITNRGETALGEVVVRGGMIAAHSSLPEREQLGGEGTALAECHHFVGLAPGEGAELSGELRVPLAELAPIRVGNAALFVPLVRFRASGLAVSGAVVEEGCVLAVGEPPATPGAGIRPFRLDLGPRLYNEIASRRLVAPD